MKNDSAVENVKKSRKLEGKVVSGKMDKTIVVKVSRRFVHPFIGKVVQKSKTYKVHDENRVAKVGDWVEINESRPLSKTKRMILGKILREVN